MAATTSRASVLRMRREELFHGLGEPSRLRILYALADGPLSVGEIADHAGLSQPNTSNHLACLVGCGLVVGERDGRYVHYRHADEHVSLLLSIADRVASDPVRASMECPRCGSLVPPESTP